MGDSSDTYHPSIGFMFVFNLIVGIGALALPAAFNKAGLILGLIFIIFLAFISYMTATFIIEAISIANYFTPSSNSAVPLYSDMDVVSSKAELDKIAPPTNNFEINVRIEIAQMSKMFLGKKGQILFFCIMIVYLYGDLAIYIVGAGQTLAHFIGTFSIGSLELDTIDKVYRFIIVIFFIALAPFCFFNFQKTKFLQVATLVIRQTALWMMIIIAMVRIGDGEGESASEVPLFDLTAMPALFGTCIYAFMVHHSIPSIITPISPKNKLNHLFGYDFGFIIIVYALLCISGVYAFGNVTYPDCPPFDSHPCILQQLYSLNFTSYHIRWIATFITLFPLFSIVSNFPMISITLRNNLQTLTSFLKELPMFKSKNRSDAHASLLEPSEVEHDNLTVLPLLSPVIPSQPSETLFVNPIYNRLFFTSLAIIPPLIIGLATSQVDALVSFTGSFAGLGIQYAIPLWLVTNARKKLKNHYLASTEFSPVFEKNPYQSPFQHKYWNYLLIGWSGISLLFIIFFQICKLSDSCRNNLL